MRRSWLINFLEYITKSWERLPIKSIKKQKLLNAVLRKEYEILEKADAKSWRGKSGKTLFHVAARKGSPVILKYEESFSLKDSEGNTALHILAKTGSIDVMKYKFEIVNITNLKGESPLLNLRKYYIPLPANQKYLNKKYSVAMFLEELSSETESWIEYSKGIDDENGKTLYSYYKGNNPKIVLLNFKRIRPTKK